MAEKEKDNDRQFEILESEVQQLTDASYGYRDIRHRFLDMYSRDIKKATKTFNSGKIRSGKARAHGGECVSDTELYECGERDDGQTFIPSTASLAAK